MIASQAGSMLLAASMGHGRVAAVARMARALALRCRWDPVCDIAVPGLAGHVLLPLSHQMPSYRARFPGYDQLPAMVADHLRDTGEALRMIDVGANVGDTILATRPQPEDRFLAFEPHPAYFDYLVANLGNLRNCRCLRAACGEDIGELAIASAARGTAGPAFDRVPQLKVEQRTLDAFWSERWDRASVNFLKIDTDGFDAQVIRGAKALLATERPWLLYECDVFLSPDGMETHQALAGFLQGVGYREAAAFDNFGNFQSVVELADTAGFASLLASQRPGGPVYYQDMLLAPDGRELQAFLDQRVKGWTR